MNKSKLIHHPTWNPSKREIDMSMDDYDFICTMRGWILFTAGENLVSEACSTANSIIDTLMQRIQEEDEE